MLEGARHASCVGNVMNVRSAVIWRDAASEDLMKALTPPLGYQQMQTAPVFIFWSNERAAYHIDEWINDLSHLARNRRMGVDIDGTIEEVEKRLRPIFTHGWEASSVPPRVHGQSAEQRALTTLGCYAGRPRTSG